jgi:hypothetical protein
MIKGIASNGKYLNIHGGYGGSTYITNSSDMGVGNVRYNPTLQRLEVYDGRAYIELNMAVASVSLSQEAELLLDWAKEKRNEELELERLALTNPAIKDLQDKVKLYQDQIKMVKTLIKKNNEQSEMYPDQSAP